MIKKYIYKFVLVAFLSILLYGCDMFDYHPYDGKITGERDINKKNITKIEANLKGRTSFKFAFISDTQRWYDDTEDVIENINARKDIDFVIHGGDVSDFGLTDEFLWQRDILNKFNIPYVVIIGNHDFLANGEEVFMKVFGEVNKSFMAGNVKIVYLNTNALELDYSTPIPNFHFIREENRPENRLHQKTIVAMHARPYSEQFNNNVADVFHDEIKKYPNLLFCLNGHDHSLNITDIFEDDIIYYGISNIAKRKYFIFTITEDTYEYEVVEF